MILYPCIFICQVFSRLFFRRRFLSCEPAPRRVFWAFVWGRPGRRPWGGARPAARRI